MEAQGGHPGQFLTCRAHVLQVCSAQGAGGLHAQWGWQHKELHDGVAERVTQGPAQLLRQLQQADVALLPDIQAHQHARLCGERVVLHGSSSLPSPALRGAPGEVEAAGNWQLLANSPPEGRGSAPGWCLLTAVRLSKSLSWSRPTMGEGEHSFRGSGLSPWGSKVGLPCSSTNVSAMHAIPAGQNPRQPPSARHQGHTCSACLHLATRQLGPCHHLSCKVPRGRQGLQEGRQPGDQRLAVPVGSQGKKHWVLHKVSPTFQESLSCRVIADFTLPCRSFLGCPAPHARGKYLYLHQESLYAD